MIVCKSGPSKSLSFLYTRVECQVEQEISSRTLLFYAYDIIA